MGGQVGIGAALLVAALVAALAGSAGCGLHRSPGVQATYERDLERGHVALRMGQREDAADAYRAALALHPGDPRALEGLARAQLALGEGEAALDTLVRLESEAPGRVEASAGRELRAALFLVAERRLRLGDSAGSLRLLRRLEGLDPGHPGLQRLLVDCRVAESGRLRVAGRSQEADALLREAVGTDAADGDLSFTLAVSLMERGHLDTTISVLSDALLRHPDEQRLQALMERALRIRYPRGFAD